MPAKPNPSPKSKPKSERKVPPGPKPARQLAIARNVLYVLVKLRDVGPAPLSELRRTLGDAPVERARRTGLIAPTTTLAGALYAPSSRGRAALQLDRSTPTTPEALLQGFMRRVAHDYMTTRGWRPAPRTLVVSQQHARPYERYLENGSKRTAQALANPFGPPPVTVQRTLDRAGPWEPVHVLAWEVEPYRAMLRADPRLRVTRLQDIHGEFSRPMREALERLRDEVMGEVEAA